MARPSLEQVFIWLVKLISLQDVLANITQFKTGANAMENK